MRHGCCLFAMTVCLAGFGCGGETPPKQAEVAVKKSGLSEIFDAPKPTDLPPPLVLPASLTRSSTPLESDLPRPFADIAPPPVMPTSDVRPVSASDLPPPPPILPVPESRPITASDLPLPPPAPK